jgi:hypothetical protein
MALENAMTPRALAAKIEELPPDKQAEVEDFIDFLARRPTTQRGGQQPGGERDEWLESVVEHRERLRREHGVFDSVPIIRDLRENGPR